MNTTPSNTRLATMLVVGVLLLPIVVGVGVVWYVLAQPQAEAAAVTLRVETPERVTEGDTVEMAVEVHNATDRPVSLVGIDLSGGYLDGFVLIRTEPPYVAEEEGPVFRGFDYNLPIPAGEAVRVVFRMQAVAAGDYAGDVDARLTGSTGLLTARVQTAVTPPGSESGAGTTDPDDDPIIIQPSEN